MIEKLNVCLAKLNGQANSFFKGEISVRWGNKYSKKSPRGFKLIIKIQVYAKSDHVKPGFNNRLWQNPQSRP